MADELNQQGTGNAAYQKEVERALNEDKQRLGDVWRLTQQGLSAKDIAAKLDISTPGFVSSYRTYIRAIKDGTLPDAPEPAKQCASALRGFAKRHQELLSPETISLLQKRADKCAHRVNDPVKREEQEQKPEHQTSAAAEPRGPGIYVYALPHYLDHPIEKSNKGKTNDRTYLKVGVSENDAIKRFRQQTRSTELPEPPILLRIYAGSEGVDLAKVEKNIHKLLEDVGHFSNKKQGAGKEWFLTNLKSLDSVAELLGLSRFAFDSPDDD